MSFYAKSVSFWPNEWIFKYSDKIMSCKLWSKVTSVFLNINFCAKMSILGKKNWISWEMLIFSNNLLEVNNLLENMLIFRKLWLFVHVQIFIRVFLLLENCYFDSKYDFIRWYFGKSVIFLVKFTFQVALFLFGKKYHFMQKVLVFDQMSEFLRTVIKSCRAKLWSKVTSVFLNSNFCAKMSIFGKKIEFRQKCWFFQTSVHYYWKWTSYWKTCLFSENCDFLCDCLYTSRNCRILIKTSIFLRKCLFVHVLIFIRVFLLLENCYFDSKYDFIRWHFGQKYHFSNKIYISVGINSLEKSSFGKNEVWFLK